MPAIVLRSWGPAFLSLEVGTNLSRDLRLVLLRNRLVPVPSSGFLSVAWDSAGDLLVLFLNLLKKLPLLAVLSPSLPERVGFLLPTELSGLFELSVGAFPALGVSVLLLPNRLLLRELLQRLKRLLEIEDRESFVEVPAELLLLERAVPL